MSEPETANRKVWILASDEVLDERGLGGGTPWWLGLIIVLGFGAIVLFLGVHAS